MAFALAITTGVLIASRPDAWVLIASPFVVVALLVSPSIRLAFVVIGGIIVLGPPDFSATKVMYLVGVLIVAAASVQSLLARSVALPAKVRELIGLSALGAVLLGLPAVFRLVSGADPTVVLRDLAPYLLLALAPLLAVDAASRLSVDRLLLIAAAGLTIGSSAFLLSWSIRRDIFADQTTTTVFGGFFMPVALLILAAVSLTEDRLPRRPMWLGLAGLAAATVIITGTRSFLLEVPAVLVAVFITGSTSSSRTRRIVLVPAMILLSGVVLALVIVVSTGFDTQPIADRWSLLVSAVSDPTGDMSLASRAAQTDTAWHLFLSSPLFGGAISLGGYSVAGYIGDTPIALLAGHGIIGLAAVLALMLGWVRLAFRQRSGIKWPRTTVIGMLLAVLTFAFILPIVEDKGLAFAFILIGAPLIRTLLQPDTTVLPASALGEPGIVRNGTARERDLRGRSLRRAIFSADGPDRASA
jgi:hypothetical protein